MKNIGRHTAHWTRLARREMIVAQLLHKEGMELEAAFHAELAVEKALKAIVVTHTETLAPYSHDLLRLAQRTRLDFGPDRLRFYANIARYCIEGRYPETLDTGPSHDEVAELLPRCEEEVEWLIQQLNA